MKIDQEISERLTLPNVSQIGVVVRDIHKTIDYYEKILSLGPFVKIDSSFTETFYYGKLVDSLWVMGFCSLGPIELELIQPISKPTIYHDFLKEKGEGIHHLGFDVKDIDEKLTLCEKIGIQVLQSGWNSTAHFAYLDTVAIGGIIFELIQRASRRA